MKLPRNVNARDLIKALDVLGYESSRQKGSHIRLSANISGSTHHITIPNHDPIKIGTLSAIIDDVAQHHKMKKDELVELLFGN